MDELMTPTEVSDLTKGAVSVGNLAQLRYTGKGPKFLKPTSKTVLYRRSDVTEWLARSERTTTASA